MGTGPLTRDEQYVARRMFGGVRAMGWNFDHERDHAVAGAMGCSHVETTTITGRGATTRDGVGISQRWNMHGKPSDYDVFVTWARLRAHFADHRTPDLVAACRANAARTLAAQTDAPSHPGRWQGVPFVVPVNDRGLTDEECHTYWSEVHLPEWRAAREEQEALLDRIYPGTVEGSEPVDLLELLAAHT